jgi:hypothetical protein
MELLARKNQSAFIKGRMLHDNFILVRQKAHKIHNIHEPCVLLELYISQASDSLSKEFLLEILQIVGFPKIWIFLNAISLRVANTCVFVNGVPGKRF